MSDQPQSEASAEIVKNLGKSAFSKSIDIIFGSGGSIILTSLVVLIRGAGIVVFLNAVFQGSLFKPLAEFAQTHSDSSAPVIWLKVTLVGAISGGMIYCIGEVIALIQKMERHLQTIAKK